MSDISLENLKSCKDAVETYKKYLDENNEVKKYNDEQDNKYRAALTAWQKAVDIETDLKKRFKGKYSQWKGYNDDDEFRLGCKCGPYLGLETPDFPDKFPQGCEGAARAKGKIRYNEYKRSYNDMECNKGTTWCLDWSCKRPKDVIDRLTKEYNDAFFYTVPKPEQKKGEFVHKNQTTLGGNVQCCANIMKLTGNINAQDVYQQCEQEIQQKIYVAEADRRQGSSENNAPDRIQSGNQNQAPPQTNTPSPSPAEEPVGGLSTFSIVVAIFGFLMVIIFCICIIYFIFFRKTKNTGNMNR